jgi:hypothetical protein
MEPYAGLNLRKGFAAQLRRVSRSPSLLIVLEINMDEEKMYLTILDTQVFEVCGRFKLSLR